MATTSRRSAAVLLVLGVVPVLTGCEPDGAGAPRKPDPSALTSAAERIDPYLRDAFPDHYAGLKIEPTALVVYRRPLRALDSSLRAKFTGTPLRLRDAAYSARYLQRLAELIRADTDYWRRRGIEITSLTPRFDGAAVQVGTRDEARAAAEMPKRYGRAPLRFSRVDPAT